LITSSFVGWNGFPGAQASFKEFTASFSKSTSSTPSSASLPRIPKGSRHLIVNPNLFSYKFKIPGLGTTLKASARS
jgi:hypothetical protein